MGKVINPIDEVSLSHYSKGALRGGSLLLVVLEPSSLESINKYTSTGDRGVQGGKGKTLLLIVK